MRPSRLITLAAAILAALAILAGCGGGDASDATTAASTQAFPASARPLTPDEQTILADFGVAALGWCQDGVPPDPKVTAPVSIGALVTKPDAVLDDGTGRTVNEAMRTYAGDLESCEPELAAEIRTQLR